MSRGDWGTEAFGVSSGYHPGQSSMNRSGLSVGYGPMPSQARLPVRQALLSVVPVGFVVLMYLRLASVLPYGQVSQQAALTMGTPRTTSCCPHPD